MYGNFAYIYDKLMKDFDYEKIVTYVERIFEHNNIKPRTVLELGCGTGNASLELVKRGYNVIALDSSIDMLTVFDAKCTEGSERPVILNMDVRDFSLHDGVDAVISLTDTLNYVTNAKDLAKVFSLVYEYLNPGGIFIFDLNTDYKFENVFGNNMFYMVDDEISYIWECKFNRISKVCKFDITFFVRQGELYKRFDEVQYERAYKKGQIEKLLKENSFLQIDMYGGMTFEKPDFDTERIFVVCRKAY